MKNWTYFQNHIFPIMMRFKKDFKKFYLKNWVATYVILSLKSNI